MISQVVFCLLERYRLASTVQWDGCKVDETRLQL